MRTNRDIRLLRWAGTAGMCAVVVIQWMHLALGWFSAESSWYYPLIFTLEFFFIAGIILDLYSRRRTR